MAKLVKAAKKTKETKITIKANTAKIDQMIKTNKMANTVKVCSMLVSIDVYFTISFP